MIPPGKAGQLGATAAWPTCNVTSFYGAGELAQEVLNKCGMGACVCFVFGGGDNDQVLLLLCTCPSSCKHASVHQ